MFENRLTRIFEIKAQQVTVVSWKLQTEANHNLYASHNIISVITSRNKGGRTYKTHGKHENFIETCIQKRLRSRYKRRCEQTNSKLWFILQEVGVRVLIKFRLFRIKTCKSFVNRTMNLEFPYDWRIPLWAQELSTFKKHNLYGVCYLVPLSLAWLIHEQEGKSYFNFECQDFILYQFRGALMKCSPQCIFLFCVLIVIYCMSTKR